MDCVLSNALDYSVKSPYFVKPLYITKKNICMYFKLSYILGVFFQ